MDGWSGFNCCCSIEDKMLLLCFLYNFSVFSDLEGCSLCHQIMHLIYWFKKKHSSWLLNHLKELHSVVYHLLFYLCPTGWRRVWSRSSKFTHIIQPSWLNLSSPFILRVFGCVLLLCAALFLHCKQHLHLEEQTSMIFQENSHITCYILHILFSIPCSSFIIPFSLNQ